MPVTINGNGSITGLSVGGLPDGSVDADTLASNAVTNAKIASGAITSSEMPSGSILQVANTTLNTTATISITNQYANNSSNIYYVTGIDTTVTTTQANSKLLISGSLSGEFSNREDFFGYVISSTISGTTAPIDALRATSGGKTNRPRYTFVPSISYNATNNDSTPNTTPFSNYLYAPAQASGTAITIRLGVACHTGGSETLYINQTVNTSTDHSDYEHMISHMTVMEVAA